MSKIIIYCGFLLSLAIPVSAWALDRPKLISESFFASDEDYRLYNDHDYKGHDLEYNYLWYKTLAGRGIEAESPSDNRWYEESCGYKRAYKTFQDIRQMDPQGDYLEKWIENQHKVFSACDERDKKDSPPIQPDFTSFPHRAKSDFDYQLASWKFYTKSYQEAYELYKKIATDKTSPLRSSATYMLLRCLSKLDQNFDAYNLVDQILADDTLKDIHSISENYRFIVMSKSGDVDNLPPELAEKHLRWLIHLTFGARENTNDVQQDIANFFDAREHLDRYFPESHGLDVDWWLNQNIDLKSPRMVAVKKLAPEIEFIDWMQSSWAYNAFDTDWLLALHMKDGPYWKENEHIVAHAWDRWQKNKSLDWLQIAISRVHPDSPLALGILKEIAPYFERPWEGETSDYKVWLQKVWVDSIRVHLGRKEYTQALDLIKNHKDFKYLTVEKYGSSSIHQYISGHVMSWLFYIGEYDEARKFLKTFMDYDPDKYRGWGALLAETWEEAVKSIYNKDNGHCYDCYSSADHGDLILMINFLPMEKLYELSQNPHIISGYKSDLTLAALTRAMLLRSRNIDKYAVAAAKSNPEIRKDILENVAGHDRIKYAHLMLLVPRLRPIPFTHILGNDEVFNAYQVDTMNHNDNNWWCRVQKSDLEDSLNRSVIITPDFGHYFGEGHQEEVKPYIEQQKTFLSHHPFRQLIDEEELSKLQDIPMAPEYLSKEIISDVEKKANLPRWLSWLRTDLSDQDAENLYLAVRSTRYGCQRNGSHNEYSHEAFKLLHENFEDSLWATATPYWFSCSHFRDGCPEKQN